MGELNNFLQRIVIKKSVRILQTAVAYQENCILFNISNFYIDVFLSIKFSYICNFVGRGRHILMAQSGINVKYDHAHKIIKLNIFETCASFPFNQTEPQQRVAGYIYFIYFGLFMCSGNLWSNIFYLRCNYITVIIGKNREAAAILTDMVIQHFHEISLSLNSNKSVSISTEHRPLGWKVTFN